MPRLTVATPAAVTALATLDQAKADLGLSGTADDALLTLWLVDASAAIATWCGLETDQRGRSSFGTEVASITYRPHEIPVRAEAPLMLPWRCPIVVTAVTVDGVALVSSSYEVDPMAALLWRLDSAGWRSSWTPGTIVVTVSAGWALADGEHPAALRQACLGLIKARWHARLRDPLLKSESVSGVDSVDYWVGGFSGGMPDDIAALLLPYRSRV